MQILIVHFAPRAGGYRVGNDVIEVRLGGPKIKRLEQAGVRPIMPSFIPKIAYIWKSSYCTEPPMPYYILLYARTFLNKKRFSSCALARAPYH